jgi:hypothetical protein
MIKRNLVVAGISGAVDATGAAAFARTLHTEFSLSRTRNFPEYEDPYGTFSVATRRGGEPRPQERPRNKPEARRSSTSPGMRHVHARRCCAIP